MRGRGSAPSLHAKSLALLIRAWVAVLALLSVTGCSSTDVAVSGPTAKCQVMVDNSLPTAPAGGATGTLTVTTTPECTWDASTATAWIAITSASHRQGTGTVTYRVAANADAAVRSGTLSVNTTQIPITQDAASCRYLVTPLVPSTSATGGALDIQVETAVACRWDAVSQASWIHVGAIASHTGGGSVTLTIDANGGAGRSGSVIIADQTVTVRQAAVLDPACVFHVTPLATAVPAEGGTTPIAVTTTATCLWDATSNATWIVITAAPTGTGSGMVPLSFAANPGGARTGTVIVAGQTVTVTQAAASGPPCTFAVVPTTASVPADGGTLTVRVTTSPPCVWQASVPAAWIVVASAQTITGSGTVQLSVVANDGAARSAVATVAGQAVTVTQAAAAVPCAFSVTPLDVAIAASGGNSSVTVAAPTGCAWTASKSASWLTIVSGASGAGNGTVSLAVSANPATSPRIDTVMVAGQAVTVTQAAAVVPCSFRVSPLDVAVAASGGNSSVTVTAPNGCAWTASKNASWLTIVSGASGAGNGTVTVAVSANSGSGPRTDTVTVAGQAVTIAQAGAEVCESSLLPSSASVDKSGTTITVKVTTGSGCAWTAQAHADWLSIVAGASGVGSGTTRVEVEKLTGAPRDRVGTVSIAGQTLTVMQAK